MQSHENKSEKCEIDAREKTIVKNMGVGAAH